MSDNTNIDPGTTPTVPVATDDIGGVAYQRVKISIGADGAATDASTANPVPVSDAGGSLTVDGTVAVSGTVATSLASQPLPTGASTETSMAASATALGAVADSAYVSGSGSVVALLKGLFAKLPALVSGRVPVDGSGVTQPVSDGGGSLTVDGTVAVSGSVAVTGPLTDTQIRATPLPVSGTVTATPTGTQAVSSAAASQADGHSANIGLLADASSANTLTGLLKAIKAAITGTVAVSGTFFQATQPVSGTVTANAGTGPFPVSDNAGSLTVDAPVATPVFVRLSDGTTAIATLPVSLASLPTLAAGTNNIGDVDVLTLPSIPAGANVIGALTANQTVNQAQVAGTAVAVNAGTASAGTQRVIIASDQSAIPVSGTIAVSGTMPTAEVRATTGAAPTAFTATTSTQVFASNVSRKLFTVYNNSDKDLYLMLAAAAASVTSYHVKVPAGGGYFATTDYSGEIRGILSATITSGQVNPGEFT